VPALAPRRCAARSTVSERAAGPTRRLAWQGTQGSHRAARWLAPAHMILGARMPRATLSYWRAKIWRVPACAEPRFGAPRSGPVFSRKMAARRPAAGPMCPGTTKLTVDALGPWPGARRVHRCGRRGGGPEHVGWNLLHLGRDVLFCCGCRHRGPSVVLGVILWECLPSRLCREGRLVRTCGLRAPCRSVSILYFSCTF